MLYGIALALASLTCTFPLFLYLTLQAISLGSYVGGLLAFLAYSLGMGASLSTLSISLAIARGKVVTALNRINRYYDKLVAGLLIAAGSYIIYTLYPSIKLWAMP